ncbi:hypothetical protein BT96DRAFT_823913 [Gymnopus androsaceus JB14]|uniref:DDE Tnp4 domain-containing protein n=1 Tax=Gymnopus androsaceus JB14 TaxID=1447944 RepID=A0A6A4HJH2_9AGAR|nr:hypothetical protein BT96DRAFT_823913 [Gymnopus androsaceus JB14]
MEHEESFEEREWIWADSAYPLQTWVVTPYKKPEHYEPDNLVFNKQVSNLCICSEHAIGFLKGHFHSLKNLRLTIMDMDSH